MATTLEEIAGFLDEEGLKHKKVDENVIYTGFRTENYKDKDGDNGVPILIQLDEDGEYIKVITPRAFSCKDSPHLGVVLQTLLMTSWLTKLVQFEYDHTDGEIRALVEFPLEDSKLTRRQLIRCVRGLTQILDRHYSMISAAIERGVVEVPPSPEAEKQLREALRSTSGRPEDLMREFTEFLARRKKEGGIQLAE